MASHSVHPDVREHGLADGCERAVFLERFTPVDPREIPEQLQARA